MPPLPACTHGERFHTECTSCVHHISLRATHGCQRLCTALPERDLVQESTGLFQEVHRKLNMKSERSPAWKWAQASTGPAPVAQ
jgi:hypothetical protein